MPSIPGTPPIDTLRDPDLVARRAAANAEAAAAHAKAKAADAAQRLHMRDAARTRREAARVHGSPSPKGAAPNAYPGAAPFSSADHGKFTKG